jgi:hypothetical protein
VNVDAFRPMYDANGPRPQRRDATRETTAHRRCCRRAVLSPARATTSTCDRIRIASTFAHPLRRDDGPARLALDVSRRCITSRTRPFCHSFFGTFTREPTCGVVWHPLRRKTSLPLTRCGVVVTVRTGPERPLGSGSGKRFRNDGAM